jgi:hypothetical protein
MCVLKEIEDREDGWMFAVIAYEPILIGPPHPRFPADDGGPYETRIEISPADYARLKPLVGYPVTVTRYAGGRVEIVAAGRRG